ncbi:hypothetical protein MuYL_2469 [Mucilaginibacter xinganensis]|uniref:Uncharacterized protein n=1 Tax=Mucilaginibacter xinganensis TaxID=1234841 RepID=A0A223NX06_9SPHI|nr:hypothetical protein MuYL_2469 [Mucilaginibacter xinganensis]
MERVLAMYSLLQYLMATLFFVALVFFIWHCAKIIERAFKK